MNKTSKDNNLINDASHISLVDALYMMVKHLKVLIVIPSLICILGFVYIQFFATPIFTSTAKIVSSSGNQSSNNAIGGLASQFGIDLVSNNRDRQWVYPEIIKSRTLAKKIIKNKVQVDSKKEEITLQEYLLGSSNTYDVGYRRDLLAVEKLLLMIEVFESHVGIYNVSVNSTDPKVSYLICSALIKELDLHQRDYNNAKAVDTRQFISDRIIAIEDELKKAEDVLRNFIDSNRRIENSPSLLLEQQRLTREVAVLTGVFTSLKQQLENAKIEEVRDSDYVIVIDHPEIPLFRTSPKKKQAMVFFGFIGIGLAITYILVFEALSNRSQYTISRLKQIKEIFLNFLKKSP